MQLSSNLRRLVWQFMSGNFLSKVSGLFRDVIMAACFGADAIVAAFIVSYRLANLLRRLFGEGALVAGFIPHFESLKLESEKKAFSFFSDVAKSMGALLLGIVLLFECAVVLSHFVFSLSPDVQFIIDMTGIMFPSILFICLYGVYSGVLQSYKKFFLTSIAPVVFNLSWILVMIFSSKIEKKVAMLWLSVGVLVGFFLQFLFTAIFVNRIQSSLNLTIEKAPLFGNHLKPLFASLLAGVIGVGATQINNACDVIFARMASLEGPAYLTYGIRVQQLPLSVFIIALSSVILPQLSRLISSNQKVEFIETLQTALYRCFFVLLPITLMCFLLGGTFVNAIYGRGGFGQLATIETTYALWAYAVGLLPMGFVILLAPAFYAQKDYKVTSIASCVSVLVNLLLNAFFVTFCKMHCTSVAYATSIAAYVNMAILFFFLHSKVGAFLSKDVLVEFLKMSLASCVAAFVTYLISYHVLDLASVKLLLKENVTFSRNLFQQLFELFGGVILFSLVYLSFCKFLKVEAVKSFRKKQPVAN
jgi:putative peptidoglycan lipid II flippase